MPPKSQKTLEAEVKLRKAFTRNKDTALRESRANRIWVGTATRDSKHVVAMIFYYNDLSTHKYANPATVIPMVGPALDELIITWSKEALIQIKEKKNEREY